MKTYDGYLIDLDGTVYLGEQRIEAAVEFVKQLKLHGIPYLFVTNSAARRPEQVAEKLQGLGIPADTENVITSGMAAADVAAEEISGRAVYMIGESGLSQPLRKRGFRFVTEKADAVIVGLDTNLTYEKLFGACLELQEGVPFYSTNPDVAFPMERGLAPGNGAITMLLSTATGRKPIYVGKPGTAILEFALQKIGTKKERTLMVGDNYDTDILAGIRTGLDTLLVLTGVTTRKALNAHEGEPTYMMDSLAEWTIK